MTAQAQRAAVRPVYIIARDIRTHWRKPYVGANPYINAMLNIDSIRDDYYADSARSIVMYFLANAQTWRGENARRIKDELREMLAGGQS